MTEVSWTVPRPLAHLTLAPDVRTEAEMSPDRVWTTGNPEDLAALHLQTSDDLLIPSLEQLICASSRCMPSTWVGIWKYTCHEYSSEARTGPD